MAFRLAAATLCASIVLGSVTSLAEEVSDKELAVPIIPLETSIQSEALTSSILTFKQTIKDAYAQIERDCISNMSFHRTAIDLAIAKAGSTEETLETLKLEEKLMEQAMSNLSKSKTSGELEKNFISQLNQLFDAIYSTYYEVFSTIIEECDGDDSHNPVEKLVETESQLAQSGLDRLNINLKDDVELVQFETKREERNSNLSKLKQYVFRPKFNDNGLLEKALEIEQTYDQVIRANVSIRIAHFNVQLLNTYFQHAKTRMDKLKIFQLII